MLKKNMKSILKNKVNGRKNVIHKIGETLLAKDYRENCIIAKV